MRTRQKRRQSIITPVIEMLETRTLLSTITPGLRKNGDLVIRGDNLDNHFSLNVDAEVLRITGEQGTTLNGDAALRLDTVRRILISTRGGDDSAYVDAALAAMTSFNGGKGVDLVRTGAGAELAQARAVEQTEHVDHQSGTHHGHDPGHHHDPSSPNSGQTHAQAQKPSGNGAIRSGVTTRTFGATTQYIVQVTLPNGTSADLLSPYQSPTHSSLKTSIVPGPHGDDVVLYANERIGSTSGTVTKTVATIHDGVITIKNSPGITVEGTTANDHIVIEWSTDPGKDEHAVLNQDHPHQDFVIVVMNGERRPPVNYTPNANGAKPTIIVNGLAGDDTIIMSNDGAGQHWDAEFHGGPGNDTLVAATQLFHKHRTSYLYGGDGNDILVGGTGDAFLDGGLGDDQITGGSARNVIVGGTGQDNLNKGNGISFIIPGASSLSNAKTAVDEFIATSDFFGPSSIDRDGDGLTDYEEVRGWTVYIKLLNDTGAPVLFTQETADANLLGPQVARRMIVTRHVTSDPLLKDTDGDGLDDAAEAAGRSDPRDRDTDDDLVDDAREANEYFSDPTIQDTDGDGLDDGSEIDVFRTSPLLADTDGDQFPDDYEVVTDNRNPRIADLPRLSIKTGNIDLRLDVRFENQTSEGTTTLESKSVQTTLASAEESRDSREHSHTFEGTWEIGASLCFGGACSVTVETGAGGTPGAATAAVPLLFGGSIQTGGSLTNSNTNSHTTESARSTQKEYSTTLSTDKEVSAESVVTRVVEGASMAVDVSIENLGDLAFTISDVEITALIHDPRDPTQFVPVATLVGASDKSVSIGPLSPSRGPFRFTAIEAFPNMVESLMQNPRGVLFKVANYTIEDEAGRRFAFVEQDVNDRTAFMEIDYAGNLPLEKHRVATSFKFDDTGRPGGLTIAEALENVLGLTFVPEADDKKLDPNLRADADQLDRSYSTRTRAVAEFSRTIDDGDPGFTTHGAAWSDTSPDGFKGDHKFQQAPQFNSQANWTFNDVPDGQYRVSVTWPASAQNSKSSHFTVMVPGNGGRFETPGVNQQVPPNDVSTGGVGWKHLNTVTVAGGQLKVIAWSGGVDAKVVADAVRIEKMVDTEYLYRVKGVSSELTKDTRQWFVFTPNATITPSTPTSRSFRDTAIFAGQGFALKFVQDLDGDGLYAEQEAFYRSIDSDVDTLQDPDVPDSRDTDGDTIDDGDEVYGFFVGNKRVGWTIRFDDGRDAYKTFPSPGRADTDLDGLTDCQELALCDITVYEGANGIPTVAQPAGQTLRQIAKFRLQKPTDPAKVDTDEDGLTDSQEIAGFRYTTLAGRTLKSGETRTLLPINNKPVTNPLSRDSDRDGLDDFKETQLGTDPTVSDGDAVLDDDGDGLVNLIEKSAWTQTVSYFVDDLDPRHKLGPLPSRSGDQTIIGFQQISTFELRDLAPGEYRVSISWVPSANLGSLTRIKHLGGTLNVLIDQQVRPDSFQSTHGGVTRQWKIVGQLATSGSVDLQIIDSSFDGDAAIDAILLDKITSSNPKNTDSDGDGLTDWEEFNGCRDRNRDAKCDDPGKRFPQTFPDSVDSDGDGLTDREEVDGVPFPFDKDQPLRFTNPMNRDSDGDGVSDFEEIKTPWTVQVAGKTPVSVFSDPLKADSDLDGLNDKEEQALGSHPEQADTDGDGVLDRVERDRRTNVLVPDRLVTVAYVDLFVGKGKAVTIAEADGDPADDAGDFEFNFGIRIPNASYSTGLAPYTSLRSTADFSLGNCTSASQSRCVNTGLISNKTLLQINEGEVFHIDAAQSFAVPYTSVFTIEGYITEWDSPFPEFKYQFGGFADAKGNYAGIDLKPGIKLFVFNDPPKSGGNKEILLEISVLIKVE